MWQFLFGTFTGWIIRVIGNGFFMLTVICTRGGWHAFKNLAGKNRDSPQRAMQDENRRIAACRDVVHFYARAFGYIARQVITREELEKKIDDGITAEALSEEIAGKMRGQPGIILGDHMAMDAEVKLPTSWRSRHAWVIGRSGAGKTNLLRTMIFQDIQDGAGIGVLAPEQELLTQEILPYIPQERIDDVIYVNPLDDECPVGFNPLELHRGDNIHRAVSDMVTIFTRIAGDITPRMNEILYHTFFGLMELQGKTLLDVELLLDKRDDSLRRQVIKRSKNRRTIRFFSQSFDQLRDDAFFPIETRMGRLLSQEYVSNILCQTSNTLNFRKAMDEGKILLFNLSDGVLGEQAAQILGQLIVSKIQITTMSRADTAMSKRRPFYLYLDEFQTFIGVNEKSYAAMLSRARKYNLGLVLANQQTYQLTANLLHDILGNVSTLICFNVAHDDAVRLSREYAIDMGGEIQYLPPEELLRLKIGEAWVKIDKSVLPLKTRLADQSPDPIRAKEIIERSRLNYGSNNSNQKDTIVENPDEDFNYTIDEDEDEINPGKVY